MKVLVVAGNAQYFKLIASSGFMNLATSYEEAEALLFTGGEDVSPSLYGERAHPATRHNNLRDEQEQYLYNKARDDGKKFIGICRGGQFLNVMNGGSLFQHVDNHATGQMHPITTDDGRTVMVTSTHHQMIRPSPEGVVKAWAEGLSTERESMHYGDIISEQGVHLDPEVVYYPKTRSLCFQPHPEFSGSGVAICKDYFYELVKNLVL